VILQQENAHKFVGSFAAQNIRAVVQSFGSKLADAVNSVFSHAKDPSPPTADVTHGYHNS
jgi:hypothetical protein